MLRRSLPDRVSAPHKTCRRHPMKSWIRFQLAHGQTGFGVLENHRVTEYEGDMFGEAVPSGQVLSLDDITLLSPCVPTKVVALWNNFRALSEKLGKPAPSHPLLDRKSTRLNSSHT